MHEISNNVVCVTGKASDQPAYTRSLIGAFASRLSVLWLLSYWLGTVWSLWAWRNAAQAHLGLHLSRCQIDGNDMPRLKLCPRDYIISPNWRYGPHYIDLRMSLILNEPHYTKNTLRRRAAKHIHRLIGAFVYSLSRIQKPAIAAFSLMTRPKSCQMAALKVTCKCLPLNMYVQ